MGLRTSGGGDQTRSIWRDVAAVDLKVLEFACARERDVSMLKPVANAAPEAVVAAAPMNLPGCVNQRGLTRCMVADFVETNVAC